MRNGQSILRLLAVIYLIVAVVLLAGGAAAVILTDGAELFAIINSAIGLVFLGVSFICFFVYGRIAGKKRKLLEAGKYVYAEVVDIDVNPHQKVQIDRMVMNPYYILCRYVDGNGKEYLFKSNALLYNPSGLMRTNTLKVYVDLLRPSYYYVDTNEILPETAVLHKFRYDSRRNKEQLMRAGKSVTAVTCGVEYFGRIVVSGMAKPGFLKIPESIARQFGISADDRGRAFFGYTILCKYVAHDGTIHIFASGGIRGEPDSGHIGEPIKVFYEGDNFKKYHVDI